MKGVPHNKTKEEIVAALRKCGGVVDKTARFLKLGMTTLRSMIAADPDLKQTLQNIRAEHSESQLDLAESTIIFAMENREKDTPSAIKAAMYMLNNRGEKRGYMHPSVRKAEEIDSAIKSHLQEMNEKMEKAHAIITQAT